ncbi:MAG: hypothetical protein ACK5H2_01130 [Beutenbergiaceae bacterium]
MGRTTGSVSGLRRHWIAIVGAGTALILLVVIAVVLTGANDAGSGADGAGSGTDASADGTSADADSPGADPVTDPPPTDPPSPVAVQPPTAGPVQDEITEQERVTTTIASVVAATNEISQRGDGGIEGLDLIATGFVLGELQNQAREQSEQGLTQEGEAVVVSSELIASDLDAATPTMSVAVCIDVSELRLFDENGQDVSSRLYNPGHPVRHIYGAEYLDDVWKISSHEIPAEQGCEI